MACTEELGHSDNDDGLFMERLEVFMQKCLLDAKAFSERENRPYEETKRRVSEWHSRQLFEKPRSDIASSDQHVLRVRQVLMEVSHMLESLHRLTGVHSFFLAVNPAKPSDVGFLGGTIVGREFWRGLRGGAEAGANAFRAHCVKAAAKPQEQASSTVPKIPATEASGAAPKSTPAIAIKNELYTLVRDALRRASGVRNAEMKWTNHDRLSVYHVHLVGWPNNIPKKNPSALNSTQNKQLLNLAKAGALNFIHDDDQYKAPMDGRDQSSDEDVDELEAVMDEFVWTDGNSSQHSLTPSTQTPWPRSPAADVGRDIVVPDVTAEEDGDTGPSSNKRARYGE